MRDKYSKPGSKKKQSLQDDPGIDNMTEAIAVAVKKSQTYSGMWYIIESGDKYFVQNTCQLQGWETLHKTYCGGKII